MMASTQLHNTVNTFSHSFRRMFTGLAVAALAVFLVQLTPAHAQSADSTQTITSRVVTPGGQGVANAQVEAVPMDSRFETVMATTNAQGMFSIELVSGVNYQVTPMKAADGANEYTGRSIFFRPHADASASDSASMAGTSSRNDEWFLLTPR